MRAPIVIGALLSMVSHAVVGQSPNVEIQAGGIFMPARRNAVFGGTVGTASATMAGGEALLRYRVVGLTARYLTGDFAANSGTQAAGKFQIADARLLAGPRWLSVDAGGAQRKFTGLNQTRTWYYLRVGLHSMIAIGGSGFHVLLSGAYYPTITEKGGSTGGSGKEVETGVMYAPRKLPLYLRVGYRFQQLSPPPLPTAPGAQPDEISGIVISGGLRWSH